MSGKVNAIALEANEAVMAVVKGDTTKSAKIRTLASMDVDRATIASLLTNFYGKEVLYQHVRNVLVTKLSDKKSKETEVPKATAEHFA